MPATSSSTYNGSTLQPLLITNDFLHSYMLCVVSRPSSNMFIAFIIISICLHLPLSVFILHHGFRQWKKRSASSLTPNSHSDCLTYHFACLELVGVTGCVLTFCAIFKVETLSLITAGTFLSSYTWFGESFFHILMCLDHYLAIVHPIMYLNLKNGRWITVRNAILGFVWLLCLLGILLLKLNLFSETHFCLVILSVVVVSFCNFSVLRVLMRPSPGGESGWKRANQSKKRAFYTIFAILGMLVFKFAWAFLWAMLDLSEDRNNCITMTIDVWFVLPSSLVVPLLFVLKTGKCMFCKKN